MSARQEVSTRLIVEGKPVIVKLIHNPIVDDIVTAEARHFADTLQGGQIPTDYRVQRDIREFLISLKVER